MIFPMQWLLYPFRFHYSFLLLVKWICCSFLQGFVFPGLYSFTLMLVLGVFAFIAEVPFWTNMIKFKLQCLYWNIILLFSNQAPYYIGFFLTYLVQYQVFLARALQLEKTSKVANVQFIVVLFWSIKTLHHASTKYIYIYEKNNFLILELHTAKEAIKQFSNFGLPMESIDFRVSVRVGSHVNKKKKLSWKVNVPFRLSI